VGSGSASLPHVGFGLFDLDFESGELRKAGVPVKLQPQPFRVLALLASRPGRVVTRQEIQELIWGNETFVDFESGLNYCVKQIRAALGDDAEIPRFIETLPKRGYRFIAPVEQSGNGGESSDASAVTTAAPHQEVTPLRSSPATDSLPPGTGSISAERLSPVVDRGPSSRQRKAQRYRALALAGVAVLSTIVVGFSLHQARRPALPFHSRDWVLIAGFDNRTGEHVFDGTLEYAMERELSNSKFVNVAPHQRINDALFLMRKPASTPINRTVGREICLRDGGIRALLIGRIEKLDTTYLLSAEILNPVNGVVVASLSEEALGQHGVPTALRRLSNQVREKLGEALPQIEQSNHALEKVTTPSLRALQFYSRGMALVNQYEWEPAALQLEEAVREDPSFASAHILLAHCYTYLEKDAAAAPHYQKAFALVDSTTDRERYFILGGYYNNYVHDNARALENYEVLVRLYPDDYWGVNNLAWAHAEVGKVLEAIPYVVRLAQLRPNDFYSNAYAVAQLSDPGDSPKSARSYYLRARALLTPENMQRFPSDAFEIGEFPVSEAWSQGDVEQADRELKRLVQIGDSLNGEARDIYMELVASCYMTLGKLRIATEITNSLSDRDTRKYSLATLAYIRGDRKSLGQYATKLEGNAQFRLSSVPPILMARSGLLSEARRAIAERDRSKVWEETHHGTGYSKVMHGELELASDRPSKAIPLLEVGMASIRRPRTFTSFLGPEALANAWEEMGNLPKAVEALESVAREKPRGEMSMGFAWMRDEAYLARLYRKVGRVQDAERIEAELDRLLAVADTDYPILVQLQKSRDLAANLPSK
jgi:DNA-binding winged helix-turn-helix (wHTH) protein/tetratricopeptide (TPR) repeat protein